MRDEGDLDKGGRSKVRCEVKCLSLTRVHTLLPYFTGRLQ